MSFPDGEERAGVHAAYMSAIRTLLVDGHPLFVESLAARLAREPDLDVLPVAGNAQQALASLRSLSPAVMVLDPMLERTDGLALLDQVRERHPHCRVVVLTGVLSADHAVEAVRRGARAWLPKTVDGAHLVRAIRGVSRGESWLPPDVLGHVLQQLLADQPVRRTSPLGVLTARERDVLQCAVDGLSKPDIARRLFLSPHTVRTHTQNMLGKLSAHSMLEAASLARQSGMRPSVG
jgi:DNA-binding NarL/FixJ family response regulator